MRQWDRPGLIPEFASDLLLNELRHLDEDSQIQSALRRFRRREWLRAIVAWKLQDRPIRLVQQQLSISASALVRGAFEFVFRDRTATSGQRNHEPKSPPIAILGLGTFGGQRCSLDSRWEIMCVGDFDRCDALSRDQKQFDPEALNRKLDRMVDMLESEEGAGAGLDFPMQLELPRLSVKVTDARQWLDAASVHGNAHHRVHLLSARPIAGDLSLAHSFLRGASSFVFPKYVSRSEIASLASYFRRLNRSSRKDLADNPSEPPSELANHVQHEIESLVHFLQLIHGCDLPDVREANTESAIDVLHREGCLNGQEHLLLSQSLEDATKCQWQCQVLNLHWKGLSPRERQLPVPASQPFADECDWTERLRDAAPKLEQMIAHLRSEAFAETSCEEGEEADLILDPLPDAAWAGQVLSRYAFEDAEQALKGLQELAVEDVRVLSTQRCRYFLSVIAPKLLERIGQTPSPDLTLKNLVTTCRSIGAKGVLWELFSLHQPSMDLYVRLCGSSPYLVGILTSNPGMIDELLDSLMLGRLPTENQLSKMLDDLCRGAEQIDVIVQSFKNTMHLNVGVRDILGKENVTETHRALSDIADVCLQQMFQHHYNDLVKRYGVPTIAGKDVCRFGVLALGKLGSREPNYHSDVTLLTVFEAGGETRPIGPVRHHQAISNDYFFHQLTQRIAQGVNRVTRYGRLFELQNWNWSDAPTSNLAWQLHSFESAFHAGNVSAQHRQMLCTARIIGGDPSFEPPLSDAIRKILRDVKWSDEDTRSVLRHRYQLEETASPENLKRGVGGTLDVETLVQILSLQQFNADANFTFQGTIESLEQLRRVGRLPAEEALCLKDAYNFLRGVESGLRLMNTKARHDLPKDLSERKRLAYGLHIPDAEPLVENCDHYRRVVRECFLRAFPQYADMAPTSNVH
jgi:glutamate-ammonia-ligase adenylyltransferase